MSSAETAEQSVDLRDYLHILRRQRWVIIAATAVGLGLGLGYSLGSDPVYSATAEVLVRPMSLDPLDTGTDDLSLETEREVVLSTSVARLAGNQLGVAQTEQLLEHVDVEIPPDTQVLEISYSDTDPRRAQQGASAFAEAYLQFRLRQALNAAFRVQENIQRQIDELDAQLQALNDVIAAATPGSAEHQQAQIERGVLLSQLTVLRNQQAAVSTPSLDPGHIIGRPDIPATPSSPRHPLNLALALFLGAFVGVIAAFIRDRLDDRVRGTRELEVLAGAPVLAAVPRMEEASEDGVVATHDGDSSRIEAYRRLRTTLEHLARRDRLRSLMVTSAVEGEGKSLTAANLARSLAQAGRQVILVSGDVRRPRLHELFEVDNGDGIEEVLEGSVPLSRAVRETGIANLKVLPSGPVRTNASELMGSERIGPMLRELSKATDFVIVDSPPVLAVADAISIAAHVDGILLVARAGTITRSDVEQVRDSFRRAGARVIGTVYTNHEAGDRAYYGYADKRNAPVWRRLLRSAGSRLPRPVERSER